MIPDEVAVSVSELGVTYRRQRHPVTSFKELLVRPRLWRQGFEHFPALVDVTFRVHRGEILGVIGANGAGKSTLLRVLARMIPPSVGRVIVRGRVAPIIDLGSGLEPDLTARENMELYGAYLGRTPADTRRRVSELAEWTGLERFLDVPLRTFSSGMVARLAFAVASDVRPDVLVLDEVLAVGDQAFQVQSRKRVNDLISGGTAAVIVSHQVDPLAQIADRMLLLEGGRVVASGPPAEVVTCYHERLPKLAVVDPSEGVGAGP